MSSLFSVSENDIAMLKNHEFRPLLNELLREEARRYGIPSQSLQLTDVDNIADEGIDARINHNLTLPSRCRIPTGLSVWQYKAGNAEPREIEREAQKPGIQDALRSGGAYCFITGYPCSHPMRKSREKKLAETFEVHNKPPRGTLLTASEIADWLSDYPVIAAEFLKIRVHDELYTFKRWYELPETRSAIEFQINEKRQTLIDHISRILSSLEQPTSIHVSGIDGIGKTRLVLEAIRNSGMGNLTFYAGNPDAIPNDFFNFIRSRATIEKIVLVVDECEDEEFRSLWRRAQASNKKLALLAIGSEDSHYEGDIESGIHFFNVDRLDYDTILKIVRLMDGFLPRPLHPELQLYIAHSVNGNVKLATAMAESLAIEQSPASTSELVTLPKMRFILQSLVSNPQEHKAMQALSLLRYVGLDEEVRTEGQLLADFLNIDFAELRTITIKMQRRGLVIKRGRFRYVTPSLLAVQLAKEVWEARNDEIADELLPKLINLNAHERLLKRLSDIGEEALATPIAERIFGEGSSISNIDGIDGEQNARLLNILVNTAPRSSMRILDHIFRDVPRIRLLEFKNGRRQIIYSLERLLRLEDTFFQAARLILRLADAENEDYGNNSTGIWHDIFYTQLGRGPYPAWEKHSLIKDALESESRNIRLLGIKALSAALAQQQFGTHGEGPGGYITKQWRPETWDEVWRSLRSALNLFDEALANPDERVITAAIEVFLSSARPLLRTPLLDEVVSRLEKLVYLDELEEQQRKSLIDTLQQILAYEITFLSNDQTIKVREWCETLFGDSFHDRLHRWVGKLTWMDRNHVYHDNVELDLDRVTGLTREEYESFQSVKSEDKLDLNTVIAQLASEGNRNPELLEEEIDWLVSPDPEYTHTFGFLLGKIDTEKIWLDLLVERVKNPQGSLLLTNYLLGQNQANNSDWLKQKLCEWVENEQELAETIFNVLINLGGSEERVQWILKLIDKGWSSCESLALLFSSWLEPLSEDSFIALLNPLITRNESPYTGIALSLIERWLKYHEQHSLSTAEVFISLLERPQGSREDVRQGNSWYHWHTICLYYVRAFPQKITKAALNQMHHSIIRPFSPQDYRLLVLKEALTVAPNIAWPLVGDAILNVEEYGYNWSIIELDLGDQKSLTTGALLEIVDIDILLNWIEQNEPDAPHIIAEFIRVEKTPLPEIARHLIIRYGDDLKVTRHLDPRFRLVSGWGSYTERLQSMLEIAKEWCKDEEKAIRDWASEIVAGLETEIAKEKVREDEEDLRWQ